VVTFEILKSNPPASHPLNNSSLHGELGSGACEYFIGDSDLLDSAPVVLVAPDVAPPQEEEHGDLGDQETTQEGLSAHNWHEKEGQHRRCQTVLEPTQLVLGDPELTFL